MRVARCFEKVDFFSGLVGEGLALTLRQASKEMLTLFLEWFNVCISAI